MHFTEREAQIVRMLAERRSQKAIARELGISRQTVKNHINNAKRANAEELERMPTASGVSMTGRLVFLLMTDGVPDQRAA